MLLNFKFLLIRVPSSQAVMYSIFIGFGGPTRLLTSWLVVVTQARKQPHISPRSVFTVTVLMSCWLPLRNAFKGHLHPINDQLSATPKAFFTDPLPNRWQ